MLGFLKVINVCRVVFIKKQQAANEGAQSEGLEIPCAAAGVVEWLSIDYKSIGKCLLFNRERSGFVCGFACETTARPSLLSMTPPPPKSIQATWTPLSGSPPTWMRMMTKIKPHRNQPHKVCFRVLCEAVAEGNGFFFIFAMPFF